MGHTSSAATATILAAGSSLTEPEVLSVACASGESSVEFDDCFHRLGLATHTNESARLVGYRIENSENASWYFCSRRRLSVSWQSELFVLTRVRIPPNPSELLGSGAMNQAQKPLREYFD